jgi:hypothetical protein
MGFRAYVSGFKGDMMKEQEVEIYREDAFDEARRIFFEVDNDEERLEAYDRLLAVR